MKSLYEQAQLSAYVMSFSTRFTSIINTFPTGYVLMGAIETQYQPNLVNISILSNFPSQWSFSLQDIAIGGVGMGFNGYTIINTGSVFSILPQAMVQTIVAYLANNYPITLHATSSYIVTYTTVVQNVNALPNITFTINNQPIVWTPQQYLFPDLTYFAFGWYLGSSPSVSKSVIYLGTTFFNGRYLTFDYSDQVMGVALL